MAVAGCPAPTGPGTPGTAPVASAAGGPAAPAGGPASDGPGGDPLAGGVFSRAEVEALFRAERAGGAERDRALRAARLVDAQGREVAARVAAYERALETLAREDPEGWAAFVETLPR